MEKDAMEIAGERLEQMLQLAQKNTEMMQESAKLIKEIRNIVGHRLEMERVAPKRKMDSQQELNDELDVKEDTKKSKKEENGDGDDDVDDEGEEVEEEEYDLPYGEEDEIEGEDEEEEDGDDDDGVEEEEEA